ncbi:uncharacterized protein LOC141650753 [Silene latifolia]|uniref:uncharacterized protein LOC141650753 n=1 Tax=Silene latifolia TaxID=37657 RepID=UPI003D787B9C
MARQLEDVRNAFLLQKFKAQWLEEGDNNTAYFHSVLKKRKAANKVVQIEDVNGRVLNQVEEINDAFENYYKNLLGMSNAVKKVHFPTVRKGKILSDEHIVRSDVILAVRDFFQSGKLLKQVNNTTLTLIPKGEHPKNVSQFRPIACCNIMYKCIAKVLCNRLSLVLPDIFSPNQSAFIKDRDIVEKILICQDLTKLYNRKICSPRVIMKLDLQKAYDSIEWSFLRDMLKALNFPKHFINLFMECVTTPHYSLSLNGETFGYFPVFCRGDWDSMIAVMRAGATFTAASGLQMNKQKSNVYGNGLPSNLLEQFAELTGLKIGKLPFKYLGVPIYVKKLSTLDCNMLVEKEFLWKGGPYSSSNALVSWKQVCLPKEQGGLGVCDIRRWNVAAVGKYVWWLMDKKDYLWVKWVHCTYLKGMDWTGYKPPHGSSWAWKRICRVKDRLLSGYVNHDWLEIDGTYSIAKGYKWLGEEDLTVEWHRLVWHSDGIPKHQFISWLYVQNRLLTKDRLGRMFHCSDLLCSLCLDADEDHAHLFFSCSYSKKILLLIQDWSGLVIPERNVLSWWQAQNQNRRKFTSLAMQAMVYHVWWARNNCQFHHMVWHPEVVWRRIQYDVQSWMGRVAKARKQLVWN